MNPDDVSRENRGYDVESLAPGPEGGRLRFIEVKGRIQGASTVTVTKNEILCSLNKPQDWVLALVSVPGEESLPADVAAALLREGGPAYDMPPGCEVRYLRSPFRHEPDFEAVSVNFDWSKLWRQGAPPG